MIQLKPCRLCGELPTIKKVGALTHFVEHTCKGNNVGTVRTQPCLGLYNAIREWNRWYA